MPEAETPTRTVLVASACPERADALRERFGRFGWAAPVATTAEEALAALRRQRVQAVLLEPEIPGPEGPLAHTIRALDPQVQIVLHVPEGAAPEEDLDRLDILGWVGRDQPLDRVLLWVRCAIKSWERLETISHHRRGLRGILDASPDLQQLQPVGNLLDTVLHQLVTLLGGSGGIVATLNHGMLLTLEDQELVKVAAGAGRYAQAGRLRNLPPRIHAFIQRAIQSSSVLHEPGRIALPLELRGQHLGAIYIETETWPGDGEDLLMVYANQVAIALENSRLYELATIDSLTGLYRRLHLFQRMREVLKTAGRAGGSVGLIVLDLDRFKSVNDTYGHPAGDRVLASIGRTLRGALRDSDVAARTGGEEFAVLLLGVGDKEAAIVAERVRTAIENTPVLADGRTLRVTASLGVATVAPEGRLDSDTADDLGATLYAAADRGVYAAKNAGGNRAMMVVPGDATQAA